MEEVKDVPARRPIRRSRLNAPPPKAGFSLPAVFSGLFFSLLFALIVFLAWSLVFSLTSLPDEYMTYVAYGTSFLAVLLGGRRATRKAGGAGLVHGGTVGVLYALLLGAIATLSVGPQVSFSLAIRSWVRPVVDIVAGLLGGIWGAGSR